MKANGNAALAEDPRKARLGSYREDDGDDAQKYL